MITKYGSYTKNVGIMASGRRRPEARVLANFVRPAEQRDIARLGEQTRMGLQHPNVVLFGAAGEVPKDDPWGPMRSWRAEA